MTRFFSNWLRKFHRWITVPTAVLIFIAMFIKLVGNPEAVAVWEKLDKIPSILMLVMAISGLHLFLLSYMIKGQRKKKMIIPQIDNNPLRRDKTDLQIEQSFG